MNLYCQGINEEIGRVMKLCLLILCSIFLSFCLNAQVELGIERLFEPEFVSQIQDKNIGLITNQSAVSADGKKTFDILSKNQKKFNYRLKAAFAPEHGFEASLNAYEPVKDEQIEATPVYSLHGSSKRPTPKMLKDLDILIYDIQNVGVRCYTYETTLSYIIEEAARNHIKVIVLDRPNPRGGICVEGSIVEEKFRCFFSYNQVPFCHGMTNGELAMYLNLENGIGCSLSVVPMKGWKRSMHFSETGLTWLAPSPNIPDAETALVYPATIVIGETLEIVSVDLRGTHPFKRIGAPWISSTELALALNQASLPGVLFLSHSFNPKWGKYEKEKCEGVFLKVTSLESFKPLLTQNVILEKLIELYPDDFDRELNNAIKKGRKKTCDYLTGSIDFFEAIQERKAIASTMHSIEELQRENFLQKRSKYLLY
ncbi:MAG: hypothetical protein S4CHLAM7_14590 [Chlamydiae bacterium]|nr:hypothetical protein [Chlamydiota bacterium]